ncbi:MAG TPA: hypothetical protein VKX49_16205 [Bryobacteraceae bacterium]|nr:hypothetical protein [Bryobacteraceae bacterium]
MKRLIFVTMFAFATTAFAADQTVTGVITDSMCKMNHAMMQKGANKMSDHDCTIACVKSGQKYVLTSGDKVYQIENQSFAGLEKNAGTTVKATGTVSADGKAITLSKIAPAGR